MEEVQEISNSNGKSVVTFTLTLPSQINPADLVSLLRQARSEKLKLGHAAAAAIGNLLSLVKTSVLFIVGEGRVDGRGQTAGANAETVGRKGPLSCLGLSVPRLTKTIV